MQQNFPVCIETIAGDSPSDPACFAYPIRFPQKPYKSDSFRKTLRKLIKSSSSEGTVRQISPTDR